MRLKYVTLTPEKILAILRQISPTAVPADAKIARMGYDRETNFVVCLVSSETFPDTTREQIPELK